MTFSKKHVLSPLAAAALAALLVPGQSLAAAQNFERQEDMAGTATVSLAQAPVPPGGTTPNSDARAGSATYIKTFANFISKTTQQKTVTPEDVQTTSDGGYILLGSTDCTTQACVLAQGGQNDLVSWLVKTDSSGNPQWQKEVGTFNVPPGRLLNWSFVAADEGRRLYYRRRSD